MADGGVIVAGMRFDTLEAYAPHHDFPAWPLVRVAFFMVRRRSVSSPAVASGHNTFFRFRETLGGIGT